MKTEEKKRIEAMRTYRTLLIAISKGTCRLSEMEMRLIRQSLIKTHGQDEVIQAENEVERQLETGT